MPRYLGTHCKNPCCKSVYRIQEGELPIHENWVLTTIWPLDRVCPYCGQENAIWKEEVFEIHTPEVEADVSA